jgi:hypothetical protein
MAHHIGLANIFAAMQKLTDDLKQAQYAAKDGRSRCGTIAALIDGVSARRAEGVERGAGAKCRRRR